MWKCDRCKEYKFSTDTNCKCKLFTIIDEDGEEHNLFANHSNDAALKYAKEYNEDGDYSLMNETVEIEVLIDGGGSQKFKISAEPDIHYSAKAIETP